MRTPLIMGVVNVTPDSFSDGGRFLDADEAVKHGERLASEGAAILDVGGESTRPGADPVTEEEELRRVVPVVERLAGRSRVSIDTTKVAEARAALEAGATIVNDVSALRFDPGMAGLVAETCDLLVSIPMANDLESLNAGVAASVTLYSISQSRRSA